MHETDATTITSLRREERRGRGEPQPRDVVVLRRVLLDVQIGLRHVRLGLVVVVVGDEVLDRVAREELAELVAELRGERLVVRDDQRRLLHLLDDPGHRRRLAGRGRAEQRLVALTGAQAVGERRDRLRLVAGRDVRGRCLERRHAPEGYFPSWAPGTLARVRRLGLVTVAALAVAAPAHAATLSVAPRDFSPHTGSLRVLAQLSVPRQVGVSLVTERGKSLGWIVPPSRRSTLETGWDGRIRGRRVPDGNYFVRLVYRSAVLATTPLHLDDARTGARRPARRQRLDTVRGGRAAADDGQPERGRLPRQGRTSRSGCARQRP